MQFKPALTDGSDPMYAPCTGVTRGSIFWKCPRRYRDLGHTPTSVKLGTVDDDPLAIARAARKLTLDMVKKYTLEEYPAGTWAWLIQRYETDEYSPFWQVKANTRESYRTELKYWKPVLGTSKISALTFENISKITQRMRANRDTDSRVSHRMTMLRQVVNYGKMLQAPGARDVADVLSVMRFPAGKPKSVRPTREQIHQIIAEGDARGKFAFSAAVLMAWVWSWRGVDIRGQWLPTDGKEGGILKTNEKGELLRWQDGLTWDMFNEDMTEVSKVISKTAKRNPEPVTMPVTPEIRDRLNALRQGRKVGPLFIGKRTGLPLDRDRFSKTWREILNHLNLPENLNLMDVRSGALTDARQMGADPYEIRDAAGHSNLATTDRYVRGRNENAAKVVQLRNVK